MDEEQTENLRDERDGIDVSYAEKFVLKLFEHQIEVKTLHFQARNRNHHSDLDKYYDSFLENMDKLVEVISYIDRLEFYKISLKVKITDPEFCLEEWLNLLKKVSEAWKEFRDIDTIIQDMIIQTKRTLYLLRME